MDVFVAVLAPAEGVQEVRVVHDGAHGVVATGIGVTQICAEGTTRR